MDKELKPAEARKLVREILEHGRVVYTKHAREEMEKDDLNEADIERALKGSCEPPEWEGKQWRYRFHSYTTYAVVTFRNEEIVVIITAWRAQG